MFIIGLPATASSVGFASISSKQKFKSVNNSKIVCTNLNCVELLTSTYCQNAEKY